MSGPPAAVAPPRVLLDVYRRGARARGVDGGQTGMVTYEVRVERDTVYVKR